jgi:hypothetical protein
MPSILISDDNIFYSWTTMDRSVEACGDRRHAQHHLVRTQDRFDLPRPK